MPLLDFSKETNNFTNMLTCMILTFLALVLFQFSLARPGQAPEQNGKWVEELDQN